MPGPDLRDYQWELGGIVFGEGCRVDSEPAVAPPAWENRTQDQPNPNSDGSSMGADYLGPGVWQFQLFTNGEDEADALIGLQELGLAWRADAYRTQPGKVTTLRYRLNGRTRAIFGRPRRFQAPLAAEYLSGRVPITADFQAVSELFFDDVEHSFNVGTVQPRAGGFVTPFKAPIRTQASSSPQPYNFEVGGVMATPAVVDFYGPLNDSGILLDGNPFIRFTSDIPDNIVVTVDARPWVTAVTRSDGGGVAGLLSPRSRMPKMRLEPGSHRATLLGSTPTGAGRAVIRWREAYPTV